MEALSDSEFRETVELLKQLIRIDTSNPPGNEDRAIQVIAELLQGDGLSPTITGASEDRQNLVCRLPAENPTERPLILSCHLDVVPANDLENWIHPPFSGVEEDGCIWGRGAIDMKGFAAMALTIFRRIARQPASLSRDLIFVAVCDEEAGTTFGSRWLVENRPDLLGDTPEYVINEVGGFTLHRDGRKFYPIQVAEKGVAWLKMTAEGASGHASLPAPHSAVSRLARATRLIATERLPLHVSEEARRFVTSMSAELGLVANLFAPLLLTPILGPKLIQLVVPEKLRASFEALLRNTATPTVLRAGEITNALPSSATCEIDGRLAPGQSANDLIQELEALVADESITFQVLHSHESSTTTIDTPLYRTMEQAIRSHDPGSFPVPSLIQGFTDSHNYAKLGAHCYGFYPVQLPEDLDFASLFHGTNERIPIAGMRWGLEVLEEVVSRTVFPEGETGARA